MRLFDPYLDTVDEVTAIKAKCMALLLEGKTTTGWSSEGSSNEKTIVVPIEKLLSECNEFLRIKSGQYPVTQAKQFYF